MNEIINSPVDYRGENIIKIGRSACFQASYLLICVNDRLQGGELDLKMMNNERKWPLKEHEK